jgi:3'5'-cyclic nucleotide phosphodiesterase
MQSTGVVNRIQISQDTAQMLIAAHKKDWLIPREDRVVAKGKGELVTYFLDTSLDNPSVVDSSMGDHSASGSSYSDNHEGLGDTFLTYQNQKNIDEKKSRVAAWTVEVLAASLKEIIACRQSRKVKSSPRSKMEELERESLTHRDGSSSVIHEVAGVIVLPDYTATNRTRAAHAGKVALDAKVLEELQAYVNEISFLYNDNPFHSFDHANHVVMSVNKLLSRINAPDLDLETEQKLHDHTYGITSDPLTWFAVVFAALIHDVDHSGVPNSQLVKEGAPLSQLYNDKSVAEQNSFDISWDLLMEPAYANLRRAISLTLSWPLTFWTRT